MLQLLSVNDTNLSGGELGDICTFAASIDTLTWAIANEYITDIVLTDNIDGLTAQIIVDRQVIIDGNGFALTFTELVQPRTAVLITADNVIVQNLTVNTYQDGSNWIGLYAIQVYMAENVVLKDVTLSGGNAALLVNGGEVTLKGEINVSGNNFGGIEVSQGIDVNEKGMLTLDQDATIINNNEATDLPTIWVEWAKDSTDGADLQGTVIGAEGLYKANRADKKQVFYHINQASQNIVTITFISEEESVDIIIQPQGTAITQPDDPTKEGCGFAGWYTDQAFTTKFEFTIMPDADLELYAKWHEYLKFDYLESHEGMKVVAGADIGQIQHLVIPSTYNGMSVVKIGEEAFKQKNNLLSVVIPDSVTSIGSNAFTGCENLVSVVISDNVTEIGGFAFNGCTSLTSVSLPYLSTGMGEGVFNGCRITHLTFTSGTNIKGDYFGAIETITHLTIGNGINSTTIAGDGFAASSFGHVSWANLTSITLTEGLTSIGYYAFEKCKNIESIVVPDTITNLGNNAFSYCTSLTSVSLPYLSTGMGEGVFTGCPITHLTYTSGTDINGSFFSGFTTITHLTIGADATSIAANAFKDWTGLTTVNISSSDLTIDNNAFQGCTSVTSITIAQGVTIAGENVFSGWTDQQTINVPFVEGNLPEGWHADWNGGGANIVYEQA